MVIFTFTRVTQEFVYALIFITAARQFTVSVVDRFIAGFAAGAIRQATAGLRPGSAR